MKNVAFTAVVLCSLWIGCIEKEPERADLWRPLEPRLTSASRWQECHQGLRSDGRAVRKECARQSEPSTDDCPALIESPAAAERVLIAQPHCTDDAVAAFERFSRANGRHYADLAAAYYVRAQREDSGSDLLASLEAADLAVNAAPTLPAAHFNRALALQELALYGKAMASWDTFLKLEPQGGWADEARAHRERIAPLRPEVMAEQWRRNRDQIPAALQARDAEKVRQLIALFPQTALQYFEEELLPQWAEEPTPENLAQARVFASALSRRFGGDRMPVETVEAIARATESPRKLRALRKAHAIFDKQRRSPDPSLEAFDHAAALFRRAGSPYAAVVEQAAIATASAYFLEDRSNNIAPALQHARTHHYLSLESRLHSTKGLIEWGSGTYIESLAGYESASRAIARTRNQQSELDNLVRMSGVTRLAGLHERAFEQALGAVRFPRMIEVRSRHLALAEASRAARALNRHAAAMHYQDAAVHWIRKNLVTAPPKYRPAVRSNLATALRGRADIKFHLGNVASGRKDFEEAISLYGERSKQVPGLRSRIKEVEARAVSPEAAVALLTEALRYGKDEPRAVRASLLAQRAVAYRALGKLAMTENDFQAALALVREEEAEQLEQRAAGKWEPVWSAFFSRFKETYEELILHLVQKGDWQGAFAHVERSRAYEPLDLIRRRHDTSPEFHAIVSRDSIDVADIRKHLPDGTFILEYSVFDDRTLVWIVSREHFDMLTLRTGREKIEGWSARVQRAVQRTDGPGADDALIAPYADLLLPALNRIEGLGGKKARRLVIVADEAMRGIPLLAARHPDTHSRLIEYAPLSFSGSATLYVYSLLRGHALRSPRPQSILLVGDPASVPAQALGLPSLRYASLETALIAGQYGRDATVLRKANATIAGFLHHAPDHDIIHFAGHSVVNREEPFLSVLFFATANDNDGTLAAHELLTRLELHRTMLFVLASCKSADNMPVGPEGVAPLVRPLIAAGVPAVIGSMWELTDATSQPLLVSFYDEYRRSGDAAASLRKAQLEMLNSENPWHRSVLTWGAFQLIGDTAPPQTARTTSEKEKPP